MQRKKKLLKQVFHDIWRAWSQFSKTFVLGDNIDIDTDTNLDICVGIDINKILRFH
jgi:hypothetical protein